MTDNTEITAPVAKAATALGAGAGTSMISMTSQAQSFLPTDLAGWLACGASAAALIYTLTIMTEWWWKKVWRPYAELRGWLKPKPRPWYGPPLEPDEAGLE